MAEPWIKIGTEILRNPKVGAAGADGLLIFIELLASCIRGDRDGVVPARYSDAKHLSGMLFLFKMRRSRVAKGLQTLQNVGLIERLPTGGFLISGWDEYWKPPYTASERQAKAREKKRESLGLQTQTTDEKTPTDHGADVTESQSGRDTSHAACHAPKGGREVGRKEGRERARDVTSETGDDDPIEALTGVRRSFGHRAIAEAERLASRDSHPLGVNGFAQARIAIEWHARLKSKEARIADVPMCYLDFLIDPKTAKLLAQPLDPAHDPGKLAAIRDANRKASGDHFPLFPRKGPTATETA